MTKERERLVLQRDLNKIFGEEIAQKILKKAVGIFGPVTPIQTNTSVGYGTDALVTLLLTCKEELLEGWDSEQFYNEVIVEPTAKFSRLEDFPDTMLPGRFFNGEDRYYRLNPKRPVPISGGGRALLAKLAFIRQESLQGADDVEDIESITQCYQAGLGRVSGNMLENWFDMGLTSNRLSGRLTNGVRFSKCTSYEPQETYSPKGVAVIGKRAIPFLLSHPNYDIATVLRSQDAWLLSKGLEETLSPILDRVGLDPAIVLFADDFSLNISNAEFNERLTAPPKLKA